MLPLCKPGLLLSVDHKNLIILPLDTSRPLPLQYAYMAISSISPCIILNRWKASHRSFSWTQRSLMALASPSRSGTESVSLAPRHTDETDLMTTYMYEVSCLLDLPLYPCLCLRPWFHFKRLPYTSSRFPIF